MQEKLTLNIFELERKTMYGFKQEITPEPTNGFVQEQMQYSEILPTVMKLFDEQNQVIFVVSEYSNGQKVFAYSEDLGFINKMLFDVAVDSERKLIGAYVVKKIM